MFTLADCSPLFSKHRLGLSQPAYLSQTASPQRPVDIQTVIIYRTLCKVFSSLLLSILVYLFTYLSDLSWQVCVPKNEISDWTETQTYDQ
jgi:hypothetical protein